MIEGIDKIRITAQSFILASERCEEQRPIDEQTFRMLMIPSVTNRAFAVELYLKAILFLEGKIEKGHKLHELYEKLSDQAKSKIVNKMGLNLQSFTLQLQKISNLFVEWRYLYELEQANVNLEFLRKMSYVTKEVSEGK